MKKLIGVLVLVAVLFAGYLVASPYIALHRMKAAADRKDDIAMAEFIDFPAVRESVKSQMYEVATRDVASDDDFAFLAPAMVQGILGPMIDGNVSQAGLTRLLEDGKVSSRLEDAETSYVSWSTFVVSLTHKEATMRFVMRRHGLAGWKLVDVRMPTEILDRNAKSAASEPQLTGREAEPVAQQVPAPAPPPELPVESRITFDPFLNPGGVIFQTRCRMNSCGWLKIERVSVQGQSGNELELAAGGVWGYSEHPGEEPDYPYQPEGVDIQWNPSPFDSKVLCSATRPMIDSGDGQELRTLTLSARQGVMGADTDSATLYMAACHAGSMDDGEFDSDLERLGYNIAW